MEHSDRLVTAGGNFPVEVMGKASIVIRKDGHSACDVVEAILGVFPLDTYVDQPVTLMEMMPGDMERSKRRFGMRMQSW